MQTVWIVEDDDNIRELVQYALTSSKFAAEGFPDAVAFEARLREQTPDLVLLDIMLPGDDGLTLLKRLRASERLCTLPVIMLTAKGTELDRVRGLDLGADDYLVKPFSVLELTARVRALLRRSGGDGDQHIISVCGITLDRERRSVQVQGADIKLTYKEFELLSYLMRNRGLVLSREKIMNAVWGFDFEGESRTIDMHVRSLRQKLGPPGEALKTVRNVGYKLGE